MKTKIIFSRDREKHGLAVGKYEDAIRDRWNAYQMGKSLQENFTPLSLTIEMLEKIDFKDKSVLVIANSETFLFLKTIKDEGKVNYKSLHFLTDIVDLIGKPGVIYRNFEKISKMDFPEKFDIVISNPPYKSNADISFLDKAYDLANEIVLFVHPSTYIVEKKGAHKPFVKLRNKVSEDIEYLEFFNGNGIFDIGLYVPCVITIINKNKKENKFRLVNHMYGQDEILDQSKISEVTLFGYNKEWSSFYKRMKSISSANGSLHEAGYMFKEDKRYLRNKDSYYVEFTRITAGNRRGKNLTKSDNIHKNDFFIIISKYQLTVKRNGVPKYDIWYEFESENQANNFLKYLQTNFVRACLAINKFAQSLNGGELKSIPLVDFNKEWNDEMLYKEFGVSKNEQEFINSVILPYYD